MLGARDLKKSLKNIENHGKSFEISENHETPLNINEHHRKIKENRPLAGRRLRNLKGGGRGPYGNHKGTIREA